MSTPCRTCASAARPVSGGGTKTADLCATCTRAGLELLLCPQTTWEWRRWLEMLEERRKREVKR